MNKMNLEQLNYFGAILAEEIQRRFVRGLGDLEKHASNSIIKDETQGMGHVTVPGGKVYQINLSRRLIPSAIEICRWYLVNPSKINPSKLVCYPHPSEAEIIICDRGHLGQNTEAQIAQFRDEHKTIQDFLEQISSGVEARPSGLPNRSWIIDTQRLFQAVVS